MIGHRARLERPLKAGEEKPASGRVARRASCRALHRPCWERAEGWAALYRTGNIAVARTHLGSTAFGRSSYAADCLVRVETGRLADVRQFDGFALKRRRRYSSSTACVEHHVQMKRGERRD